MGGPQGIASYLWSHLTVAQDEVRQDGEDRFARGALDTPERETAHADTGLMGLARQAPTTAVTGCLVCEREGYPLKTGQLGVGRVR
jgi:hypothetical protein